MRRVRFPVRWKLLVLSLSVLAVGVLWPSQAGSIYWDGEWLETPYAMSQESNCHAEAGEVCMEWVIDGSGTGSLCCATGDTCQLHNFRFE